MYSTLLLHSCSNHNKLHNFSALDKKAYKETVYPICKQKILQYNVEASSDAHCLHDVMCFTG